MDRRHFLKSASLLAVTGVSGWPSAFAATGRFDPSPEHGWRLFEVTTCVELDSASSPARVWLPLPSVDEATWSKPMGNLWLGNAATSQVLKDPVYGTQMLAATWEAGTDSPFLEVTSRFAARDRAVDLRRPSAEIHALDPASRRLFTQPTELLPIDGIVRTTALQITRNSSSDLEKAQAIYQWIVDHTARNPKTRGCGVGDIRAMLETGDLTGKCADLNALYVGLARAAGLPARDVYGIRVTDSRFGYKSLGKRVDISKAQHCRAEVWLAGFGWLPVDPADVRKVVLEEQPGLTLQDELVVAVRERLFGAWEMNWLAYNFAHDLVLPGSAGPRIPFFMYPQGENQGGRFDSLAPETFRYRITANEITR